MSGDNEMIQEYDEMMNMFKCYDEDRPYIALTGYGNSPLEARQNYYFHLRNMYKQPSSAVTFQCNS